MDILPQAVLYESVDRPTVLHRTAKTPWDTQTKPEPRNAANGEITHKIASAPKRRKLNAGTFPKGNQAAAKEKWTPERVRSFQRELAHLRNLLGYNYSQMGDALEFSGSYVKLLEGGYASDPLRQPSERFVSRFEELKQTAARAKKFRLPRAAVEHVDEIFSHILGKRFKCPECAKLVKAGELDAGLEYWWARVPGQKHCPKHSSARRHRAPAMAKRQFE